MINKFKCNKCSNAILTDNLMPIFCTDCGEKDVLSKEELNEDDKNFILNCVDSINFNNMNGH